MLLRNATITDLQWSRREFMFLFIYFSVSGVQAATYSYIGEFHSNSTRTRAAAFVAMFMPACFVYLPLLAWLIIPMQWELYLLDFKITPWRLYLFCSSLLNCVNFICLYFLPESPKFLLSIDKKTETLAVLRRMYEINTGNPPEVWWSLICQPKLRSEYINVDHYL